MLVIIGAHVTMGKIHPNEMKEENNSSQVKGLLKDEYIPLNSITLERLYNKNNSKHALDPKKRNRWIKPKKKSTQKLKHHKTNDGKNHIDSKGPPTSSKSRSTNIVSLTPKVRFEFMISLSNVSTEKLRCEVKIDANLFISLSLHHQPMKLQPRKIGLGNQFPQFILWPEFRQLWVH